MSAILKVVIDTNTFISAVLFKGETNKLVDLWQKEKFTFLISREILDEYIKVLSYPKFKLTSDEIKHIINTELLPFVEPYVVKTEVDIIKDDPSDNKFLALAITGKSNCIISGDKHLLAIRRFRGIKIITPHLFLSSLQPK